MCSRDVIRPQPFWQIQRNPKPRETHLTNLTNPTILASFNKSIDGLTLGIRYGPWSDKDMTAKIYSWSGGQNSIHNLRLILWRLVKVKCQAYFVNELMFSVKVCIHTLPLLLTRLTRWKTIFSWNSENQAGKVFGATHHSLPLKVGNSFKQTNTLAKLALALNSTFMYRAM